MAWAACKLRSCLTVLGGATQIDNGWLGGDCLPPHVVCQVQITYLFTCKYEMIFSKELPYIIAPRLSLSVPPTTTNPQGIQRLTSRTYNPQHLHVPECKVDKQAPT